jgi:transcription termination factor Rho
MSRARIDTFPMSEKENTIVPGEITPGEVKVPARKRATKKAAKKAAKKAVKKRATKKAAAPKAKASESQQAEMFSESTPTAAAPRKRAPKKEKPAKPASVVYSTDSSDEPYADQEPATAKAAKEPSVRKSAKDDRAPNPAKESSGPADQQGSDGENSDSKPAGGRNGGRKPNHQNQKKHNERGNRNDGGNRNEGGNRNDRGNRNSKFNKNKPHKKGGKGRWQNKKKRSQEEDSPIEFGELLEFEVLQRLETIHALAAELTEGGSADALDYNRVYDLQLPELRAEVEALSLEVAHAPNRDQLINALVTHAATSKAPITTTGILEMMDDDEGGIIVYQRDSYRIKALSAYVPQAFIEHYGLQRGHIVKAQLHPHRENESCPFAVKIHSVMDQDPETLSEIVPFTERVPYYPLDRILMEADSESKWDNLSMRVVDCLTPIGFGQRGLIVAPPRTGKTILMQGMANSIQRNYPDSHLIILLIDERPEEVTDFRRQVSGEVISSTFDESAESHVHAAEMVIEKARRMVEVGKDVIILLDSITRLARAYNTTMPSSGKILSGGVEANALQKPKRFFGSARNIEDGGSLTIIATALVETGSKMDEVIFEEFKGTGNMELHLDRGLSDKRIFPALSMDKSGTRKEELLYHPDEMLKIYSLRRAMKGLPSTDAMEMLIQRIKKTKTNAEFLMSVAR